MTRRLLAIALIALIALAFSACTATDLDGAKLTVAAAERNNSLKSENQTITLTIPANVVKVAESYIKTEANNFGINDIEKNQDGTISYKITPAQKDELKKNIKAALFSCLQDVKSQWSCIDSINIDADCTTVTILADKSKYTEPKDSFFLSVYIPAITYLAINGSDAEELDNMQITFSFIDKSSYESIGNFVYPEKSDDATQSEPGNS